MIASMAAVHSSSSPLATPSASLSSLLATHRHCAPGGALLLLFQSSNPCCSLSSSSSSSFSSSPFRPLSHRRSFQRFHRYRFSAVLVQHGDSEQRQSSHGQNVEATPSFSSFDDSGRSRRSANAAKDTKSSQESSRSNVYSSDEGFQNSEPISDPIADRELPWESSDKPLDVGFDLPYSFDNEATSKVESFPSPSREGNDLVISKKRQPFPTFDVKSRLKAPWDQKASSKSSHREGPEGPRKFLAESRPEADEEDEEQIENDDNAAWDKSAMDRLLDKLNTIGSGIDSRPRTDDIRAARKIEVSGSAGDARSSKGNVFDQNYSSSLQFDSPDFANIRFPWEKKKEEKEEGKGSENLKRLRAPYRAELLLSESALKRLRNMSLRATFRLKMGKDGVTPSVIEGIHQQWRQAEIVRIKCEGPPAANMKKTHEELEEKTGGLVIWRSGSAIVVYRGQDYGSRLMGHTTTEHEKKEEVDATQEINVNEEDEDTSVDAVKSKQESPEEELKQEYIKELETILDGLGPRFEGWIKATPVPVDGDLLPEVDPNFKPPIRRLPYRMRAKLSNTELTALRRVARPLPPHFVLSRNRNLEGLAAAIVKLWEKSEVVKICVKRGVQNTRNERMAEELKRLTGGVLLSRDKYFIVIYRGKDFLPPSVAEVLQEREALADALQEDEEQSRMAFGRLRAEVRVQSSNAGTLDLQEDEEQEYEEQESVGVVDIKADMIAQSSSAGTLTEALEVRSKWESLRTAEEEQKDRESAEKAAQLFELQKMERKLEIALLKKQRAEHRLAKVQKGLEPVDPPTDREAITDEEKYMFRKLGLKMKAFLLIGRRGVFDGVVQNMHLHWKHRELVKIILKERDMVAARDTARMLEYESGGILIDVVTVSKGQAIIVYRGKNYERPPQLRPLNLLTKRKALQRSLELQRRSSLEEHIEDLQIEVYKIKKKYGLFQESDSQPSTARIHVH